MSLETKNNAVASVEFTPASSSKEDAPKHLGSKVAPLILCVIAALIIGRGMTFGDFWWSDASRHAMDGVFLYDVLRDRPLHQPHQYALRYYAQYPALGIAFYPPLFALVEALFFAVFGLSAFAARLTVLAFGLLAVFVWYRWMERLAGATVAFVSAVVLITSPLVVRWAREVMLEMPTVALIIAACFFADRYVRTRHRRCLYACVVIAALSAWTKQTALFMLPVLMIYVTIMETLRFWLTRPAWIAALWGAVILIPLIGYTLALGGQPLQISVGSLDLGTSRYSGRGLTFYLAELLPALTPPVLVLSVIGLGMMLFSSERKRWTLPLVWVIFGYIFFWYIAYKEDRYLYFWLPPFALFAAWSITRLTAAIPSRALAFGLLALFCGYRVVSAYAMPTPYVVGYEPAAAHVAQHAQEHLVMFDGYYAGCFIFHLRRYDPHKARIVLRADKMFNPVSVRADMGQKTLVHSKGDIRQVLDKYGVNQIVLENGPPLSPASRMLREMLPEEGFSLVKRFEIESRDGHNVGDALLLYERKGAKPQSGTLTIEIPAFNRKIEVPLKSLSK